MSTSSFNLPSLPLKKKVQFASPLTATPPAATTAAPSYNTFTLQQVQQRMLNSKYFPFAIPLWDSVRVHTHVRAVAAFLDAFNAIIAKQHSNVDSEKRLKAKMFNLLRLFRLVNEGYAWSQIGSGANLNFLFTRFLKCMRARKYMEAAEIIYLWCCDIASV